MSGYNTNLEESGDIVIGGTSSKLYQLYLHVQGVVELMEYVGGTASGLVLVGGTPKPALRNTVVELTITSPAQTLYLNRSQLKTDYSVKLDYYFSVWIAGGAVLVLSLTRGDHTLQYQDFGGGLVDTAVEGEYIDLSFSTTLEANVVEERAASGTTRNWLFSGYEKQILGLKAEK